MTNFSSIVSKVQFSAMHGEAFVAAAGNLDHRHGVGEVEASFLEIG
ncbi:hypothetical protein [Arenibacterium halophilum]|nr:hypothetical protein [Arenibacterium halophilum]